MSKKNFEFDLSASPTATGMIDDMPDRKPDPTPAEAPEAIKPSVPAAAPETEDKDSTTRKKDQDKRTERVQILLTPAEREILRRLAYFNDTTFTAIIMDALKATYKEFK